MSPTVSPRRSLGRSLGELFVPSGTSFTAAEGITFGFSYFTVGLTVAVLHVTEGTSAMVMIATVFLVNSVTPTLAFAAVSTAGGSTVAGILSGWLVASRFGLFAAAIAPRLWPSRLARAVAAHASFDPNVAVAQREETDEAARRVYTAASLWLCLPWWVGGVAGVFVGDRIGDPQSVGLDAIFPAALVAIVWPQLRDRSLATIAGVAAVIALALVESTPGGVPVLAGATTALLAMARPNRGRRC